LDAICISHIMGMPVVSVVYAVGGIDGWMNERGAACWVARHVINGENTWKCSWNICGWKFMSNNRVTAI
jgi:hypothetical protein